MPPFFEAVIYGARRSNSSEFFVETAKIVLFSEGILHSPVYIVVFINNKISRNLSATLGQLRCYLMHTTCMHAGLKVNSYIALCIIFCTSLKNINKQWQLSISSEIFSSKIMKLYYYVGVINPRVLVAK